MRTEIHTKYQPMLQRQFFRVWLFCAGSFTLGLLLQKNGFDTLGVGFLALFAVGLVGGFGALVYRHYHVGCLQCLGRTRTRKDPSRTRWLAICERCRIAWDLQTGAD